MKPEVDVTTRAKEKSIAAKRVVAEAGAETRFRVEAKAEVGDWYVGILTDVLNKIEAASNRLKRVMVRFERDTKEKVERSRAEIEAVERAAKEEKEAALQDMIQTEVKN